MERLHRGIELVAERVIPQFGTTATTAE